MKALFVALSLLLAALTTAQTASHQTQTTTNFVKDVTELLAKTYNNRAELTARADRLAENYAKILRKVKAEVTDLVAAEIDNLGLKQKLNLALELWRVRASLDLLALTNPATLKDLTGLTVPDLTQLQKRVGAVKIWSGG